MRIPRAVYNQLCNDIRNGKEALERRIASKETIKSMAETMAVPIGTFKDACAAVGIELPKRPAPVAKNGANGADTTDARLRDLYARVQSLEKQVEQLNPSLL